MVTTSIVIPIIITIVTTRFHLGRALIKRGQRQIDQTGRDLTNLTAHTASHNWDDGDDDYGDGDDGDDYYGDDCDGDDDDWWFF